MLLSYTDKELDDMVDYILNGNYIYKNKYVTNENNESFYYKKINNILSVEDDKSKFLKGLIEIDGDLSKQYFVEFYEENPNHKYVDISAIKVADYYYARGVYLKASEWYKKTYKVFNQNYEAKLNKKIKKDKKKKKGIMSKFKKLFD